MYSWKTVTQKKKWVNVHGTWVDPLMVEAVHESRDGHAVITLSSGATVTVISPDGPQPGFIHNVIKQLAQGDNHE